MDEEIRRIIEEQESKRCCDNCIHYRWYYDKCIKWDCEVDARSMCNNFERRPSILEESSELKRK